ncbi:MAG TPA: serine/threonine-protein kinase [Candidatus Saccharimonadales bacterium]|nr:serine/threonine-protein kinase [Candidatus Saccharimonadales bacterium]
MNMINEGTYGRIYTLSDKNYALKRNLSENESTFISSIRELNILYLLRHHPNIIKIEEVLFGNNTSLFPPSEGNTTNTKQFSPLKGEDRKTQKDDGVHFIFKKAKYDLHEYIFEHNKDGFKMMKGYMVDIMLGLHYMHQMQIIHRDLKPGNILIFDDGAKICDFGFSKPMTKQGYMTPSICTVPYRAPEITMSNHDYDYKTDVWSLGCVFFEMISKKYFIDEIEDDDRIILKDILAAIPYGLTAIQFKEWVTNNKTKEFKIRNTKLSRTKSSFQNQLGLSARGKKAFSKQCGDYDTFCDLLNHMLHFHPSKRYSIDECLQHAFFSSEKQKIKNVLYWFCDKKPDEGIFLTADCQERQWMAKTAMCLFDNRDSLNWYTHRCLFQAVDLFQRYLYAIHFDQSDQNGHDEFHTNLFFMACIYMSIKYFSTIHMPIPFSDIVEKEFLTDECLNMVEQFEGGLIKNCFHYDIYHQTVYEAADPDMLTDDDCRQLLSLITTDTSIIGQSVVSIYQSYKSTNVK